MKPLSSLNSSLSSSLLSASDLQRTVMDVKQGLSRNKLNQNERDHIESFKQSLKQSLAQGVQRASVRVTSLSSASLVSVVPARAEIAKENHVDNHDASQMPLDMIANVQSQIGQAQTLNKPPPSMSPTMLVEDKVIPSHMQNVLDSTKESTYVYETQKGKSDRVLCELEEGVRRAYDTLAYMKENAKDGYCAWIPSPSGAPSYLSRDAIIADAQQKLDKMKSHFQERKQFLGDPAAMKMAEIAYQIANGKPSEHNVPLSAFDRFLVEQRRAGNMSTDGSIERLFESIQRG